MRSRSSKGHRCCSVQKRVHVGQGQHRQERRQQKAPVPPTWLLKQSKPPLCAVTLAGAAPKSTVSMRSSAPPCVEPLSLRGQHCEVSPSIGQAQTTRRTRPRRRAQNHTPKPGCSHVPVAPLPPTVLSLSCCWKCLWEPVPRPHPRAPLAGLATRHQAAARGWTGVWRCRPLESTDRAPPAPKSQGAQPGRRCGPSLLES
mmetsp:Transcript_132694/g.331019  ORF Transcript_132694/g.331019 Transcript_132694/m.331019 type:complete len:200 (-) Transcript_132694:614-1213(-)